MTAWWQHAVSESGTLLLSQEECSVEVGGQGSPLNRCNVPYPSWQHAVPSQEHCHSSVLWCCWFGKGTRPAFKNYCHISYCKFSCGIGLLFWLLLLLLQTKRFAWHFPTAVQVWQPCRLWETIPSYPPIVLMQVYWFRLAVFWVFVFILVVVMVIVFRLYVCFYPRDAMLAQSLWQRRVRLSVRPSVRHTVFSAIFD